MNLPISSDPFVSLVDTAGPAIVRVDAPRHAGATGLLWSDDGLVITAHHALRHDEPLRVALSGEGEPLEARLLGRDPSTDLAVLRVDLQGAELHAPAWREASSVRVGELGLALARPGRTIRAAMALVAVVGEGLRTRAGRSLAPYVELDRTLPRGFSVAPLFGLRGGGLQGEVLGLATAGLAPEATVLLTHDTVRASVEAIVAHGRVPQAFLGVGVAHARLTAELRERLGQGRALVVVSLAEHGPAARAGILVGDLILTVGGAPVRSPMGLRAQLADRVGQPVSVRLLRGGQTTDLEITAGERQ